MTMVQERVPTGRLMRRPTGRDLVVRRRFIAPIGDVWAQLTDAPLAARWFGTWSGEAAVGARLELRAAGDLATGPDESDGGGGAGAPTAVVVDAPQHLELVAGGDRDRSGPWHVQVRLAEHLGLTELTLVHHLRAGDRPAELGPRWEHALDRLGWSLGEVPIEPDPAEHGEATARYYEARDPG